VHNYTVHSICTAVSTSGSGSCSTA